MICRSQTGNLLESEAKQELIDFQKAYLIDVLGRKLSCGDLREADIFNANGTYFVIHQHDAW